MTARTGQLEGVEASRGAAAILVVGVHVTQVLAGHNGTPAFGGLMSFGHAGVDCFFVLSRFIITFTHGRDLGRPGQFWQFSRKRLIVHRLVERPVMRYARRGSNRPVPRSPTGVVLAQTGLGE